MENMIRYAQLARDYAEQGFEPDSVAELLGIDGCPKDVAKDLAENKVAEIPEDYHVGTPPVSYEDIRATIDETIKRGSLDKLKEYFEQHSDQKLSGIINRILLARDSRTNIMFEEIHKELEPVLDDIVITNKAMSGVFTTASNNNSAKEAMEQELFGIWSPSLIQKHAKKEEAERFLMERTKKKTDLHSPLFR